MVQGFIVTSCKYYCRLFYVFVVKISLKLEFFSNKAIPEKVKPVMIFLCLVQAGSIKTYYDVGICMEAMKMLCLKEYQMHQII